MSEQKEHIFDLEQRLVEQAYEKITAAQKANEYQLGGNAAKAKELLEEVNRLLKEAAKAAA